MRIKVITFAQLAERLGWSGIEIELSDNATVRDALEEIQRLHPKLDATAGGLATAVNMGYVDPGHELAEGDELALIPPVSGG